MNKFENIGLNSQLLTAIDKLGYSNPTEIQGKIIPHIMEGKDVIGESSTGSGKTLAFGCGVINTVNEDKGLQALILAPTRELVDQVRKDMIKISFNKKLHITSIYGGVGMGGQIENLKKTNIVIATPGRLLDHYRRGNINLNKLKILVLDEADCMLDMGFIEDIEKIINACPKDRQTLLFSATINGRIRQLSTKYLRNSVDIRAEKHVDPSKLTQIYYDVNKNAKLSLLLHTFEKNTGLSMIFCNTRKMVDFVTKNLRANKISTVSIHGGLTQNKRIKIIEQFNKGKFDVLVCTDVAARGLHIADVSHIYNYEIPKDPTDYVHRIGRTARAGESGKVINLLCEYDHDNFSRVKSDYRDFNIDKVETPKVKRIHAIGTETFGKPKFKRNSFRRSNKRRYNNRR
tara:strand:+ start:8 stop:1213 length:1206 start_codon:yes stop_codon:yes gene_type:complete